MSRALSPSVDRCYGLARVARCGTFRAQASIALSQRRRRTRSPVALVRSEHVGRGTGRSYPPANRCLPPSRRGLPQVMGAVALCWRSREPPPCATADARERLARAAPRWTHRDKPHDGSITTEKVDEMWGTDMTQTITLREGRANVFVAVEHANWEFVGIHARGRPIASRPWSRSARACIGASEPSRPAWRVD